MSDSKAIWQSTLRETFNAITEIFKMTFSSEDKVISDEAKKILSDPENRQRYLKGIEELKKTGEAKVVLKDNTEFMLIK